MIYKSEKGQGSFNFKYSWNQSLNDVNGIQFFLVMSCEVLVVLVYCGFSLLFFYIIFKIMLQWFGFDYIFGLRIEDIGM